MYFASIVTGVVYCLSPLRQTNHNHTLLCLYIPINTSYVLPSLNHEPQYNPKLNFYTLNSLLYILSHHLFPNIHTSVQNRCTRDNHELYLFRPPILFKFTNVSQQSKPNPLTKVFLTQTKPFSTS